VAVGSGRVTSPGVLLAGRVFATRRLPSWARAVCDGARAGGRGETRSCEPATSPGFYNPYGSPTLAGMNFAACAGSFRIVVEYGFCIKTVLLCTVIAVCIQSPGEH
jgi:hypothetical protein